jgi:hypothetical protein
MNRDQYFKALCDAEAADVIRKRVNSVSGILQMRPAAEVTDYLASHLYAIEDPFAYVSGLMDHKKEDVFVQPPLGKYMFFDTVNLRATKADDRYLHFFRDVASSRKMYQAQSDRGFIRVPYIVGVIAQAESRSRYGYTWRGISRPHDRELGIGGGELILIDLQTGEVLAYRRGFAITGEVRNVFTGVWWTTAGVCPQQTKVVNGKTQKISHVEFIYNVLMPDPDANRAFLERAHDERK